MLLSSSQCECVSSPLHRANDAYWEWEWSVVPQLEALSQSECFMRPLWKKLSVFLHFISKTCVHNVCLLCSKNVQHLKTDWKSREGHYSPSLLYLRPIGSWVVCGFGSDELCDMNINHRMKPNANPLLNQTVQKHKHAAFWLKWCTGDFTITSCHWDHNYSMIEQGLPPPVHRALDVLFSNKRWFT